VSVCCVYVLDTPVSCAKSVLDGDPDPQQKETFRGRGIYSAPLPTVNYGEMRCALSA